MTVRDLYLADCGLTGDLSSVDKLPVVVTVLWDGVGDLSRGWADTGLRTKVYYRHT